MQQLGYDRPPIKYKISLRTGRSIHAQFCNSKFSRTTPHGYASTLTISQGKIVKNLLHGSTIGGEAGIEPTTSASHEQGPPSFADRKSSKSMFFPSWHQHGSLHPFSFFPSSQTITIHTHTHQKKQKKQKSREDDCNSFYPIPSPP